MTRVTQEQAKRIEAEYARARNLEQGSFVEDVAPARSDATPRASARPNRRRAHPDEYTEQVFLFDLVRIWEGRVPELRLLHHIPNGGKRDAITGARLKRAGVRAGVLDLHLPVARGGYHGLWIELKVDRNKATETQQWWIERLVEEGHKVVVCWGHRAAWAALEAYLGVEMPLSWMP